MLDGVNWGKGSYLNCLWRFADSVMGPASATLAHALTDGDGTCRGAWRRQVQWPLDRLWRSEKRAKKRARRRERRRSAHEATAKEMQLIEQARLENELAVAEAERAAATIQQHFGQEPRPSCGGDAWSSGADVRASVVHKSLSVLVSH